MLVHAFSRDGELGPIVLFADWFARPDAAPRPPSYAELVALPEAVLIRSAGLRNARERPVDVETEDEADSVAAEEDENVDPDKHFVSERHARLTVKP